MEFAREVVMTCDCGYHAQRPIWAVPVDLVDLEVALESNP
jgi:hypothetical protein